MSAESTPSSASTPPHQPYIPPERIIPELTFSAVLVGALLGIIFGASSLYLVLKVGMTVSASIPIAVLSITLFRVFTRVWPLSAFFRRDATILENNIVQTTGSAGESIAFGVGVTMPALMILGYDLEVTRVILVSILGGILGILMMIPLRRAFIVKQHGKLPYPEGTACADVLIVGEKGGSTAKTVFVGFGIAFVYKFLMSAMALWRDIPTRTLGFFKGASVSAEVAPELLGVGYIIGPRISCIMVGGGILASWVLIPMIVLFGSGLSSPLSPGDVPIARMSLDDIWYNYVLYIGAGAVAAGGIISMVRALPLIVSTLRSAVGDFSTEGRSTSGAKPVAAARVDRDLSMRTVAIGCILLIIAIRLAAPWLDMNTLGAALIVLFGFLFVTVSSRLTGEIGSSSNPISGMTVATLLLTCLIFWLLGWVGEEHRLTALTVAGIVCIAASNGGTTAQDLKTGFLVGATPRHQQVSILVGALTSALVLGSVLLLLNRGSTIYSKKDLPAAVIDAPADLPREAPKGQYADDTATYRAIHIRAGEREGVRAGKYLLNDDGTIRYLVDPGINGALKFTDDGREVSKYKAPKATLMAFIIDGILTQRLPWELVLLGVAIAIVLELSGIPSLPFAVGVYLPLSASTPIFFGGMIRFIVDKWKKRSEAEGDMSPGVLLSAGYIAGGSMVGIVVAVLSVLGVARYLDIRDGLSRHLQELDRLAGEAVRSPGFYDFLKSVMDADMTSLLPFALIMVFLLLAGGEKVLRSSR